MPALVDLSALFDELFPICRSIAGPGTKKSLEIISRHIPIAIEGVASGSKVFDWVAPPEWSVNEARLTGPDGETIVDFADHNLHVMNFSESVDEEFELEDLQKRLHSLPKLPDAIPYVTSYYSPNWGFCLTDRRRKALKPGKYRAKIDANKVPGELNYGVVDLPGDSDDVILISSYVCHPSMANNELSGPLALVELYNKLAAWPKRHHTFRFLLIPETIGSICYLHAHGEELRGRLKAGVVLTCLGGHKTSLNVKLSRGDLLGRPAPVDQLARHLAETEPGSWELRPFTPISGSDERQFCSPGFDFPVVQVARTIYGQYEEYHTSQDTKAFMRIERVEDSADRLNGFLMALDHEGVTLRNLAPFGEPNLGNRGLYPHTNSPLTRTFSSDNLIDARRALNLILHLLSFSDGTMGLRDIAGIAKASATELVGIAASLEAKGLLKRETGLLKRETRP